MDEDFSRQTRRFSAAILTDCKGKRRSMAGKRPSRRRSTVVNTGSKEALPSALRKTALWELLPQGGCLSDYATAEKGVRGWPASCWLACWSAWGSGFAAVTVRVVPPDTYVLPHSGQIAVW